MAAMTTLPRGRELSRADLDAMPDDGNRYELVDGAIIVTPSSKIPHEAVSTELVYLLRRQCPDDLRVFAAPFEVGRADGRTATRRSSSRPFAVTVVPSSLVR
jgi:Uma2 family endonuclease